MKSNFRRIINRLIGDPDNTQLEERIFNSLMVLTFIFGVLATFYNVLLENQPSLTACSILGGFVGAISYYYSLETGNYRSIVPVVIVFLFAIMIVSWLTNAGTGGAGAFFFFLLVTIGVLLMNTRFISFMAAVVTTLIGLMAIEYYFPSFLVGYASATQHFWDVSISLLICIVFNGMMIRLVFSQYLQEKQRNDELLVQAMRDKDELEHSNECNRILLKEVYHRTKNNMLVIISMLNLRAMSVDNANFRQLAVDTENRIRAMALVHEQLYQSANLRNLDFGKYLENMARTLVNSTTYNNRIAVEIDCKAQTLSIDIAVPLGLVINEIITNALKHAFPDNMPGKIQITMYAVDDKIIELRIADNGIGLPSEVNPVSSKSLGMQINTSLIQQQLKGTIAVSRENGTTYTIRIPKVAHNPQIESLPYAAGIN